MELFKYLYYRLYIWNLKTWGVVDAPHWNALLGVTFMMYFNLLFIAFVLEIFNVHIIIRDEIPKKEAVALYFILIGINYFQFVHKEKYKKIAQKLKKETPQKRRRNTVLLWLYVVLSFVLLAFCAILAGKLNGQYRINS